MSLVLDAAVAVVFLATGYAVGRLRPWRRLADWTHHQLRFRLDRWHSTPRQAVLAVLLVLTDPAVMTRSWRRRNTPPTHAPAPVRKPLDG